MLEHDGRLVEVVGSLAVELRDVETGPACPPTLRDAVVLRWVRGRAAVDQLDDDPEPIAPVSPVDERPVYWPSATPPWPAGHVLTEGFTTLEVFRSSDDRRVINMSRMNAVSQAYLLWRRPMDWTPNHEYLTDAASLVGGQQVDEAELREMLELLGRRGLVTGPTSLGCHVPDPALLTDEGMICVADFDGNVQKWIANNRPGVFDQSTHVTGQGNQVVAHSTNVQQSQHTEISNVQVLRDTAEQALVGLDMYEIEDEDEDGVRRAAQRALDETEDGEPEPDRLRRLATTLWAALLAFANTTVGTTFAERLRDILLPLVNLGAA